ncbi:MAG: hydantoinase B/oxoprolinase family protein [Acetobacteraceae bacterium]
MAVDPVDRAVITQALLAAAREMGTKLVRSAYSTIVREARDASAAILDREGNVVAQAEMVPMQLGSMGTTLRPCLAHYRLDEIEEDDFFVNNHPYQGGQHLQDVFIFSPIFVSGRLVGFAGSVAHHLELGGGGVGLNNAATDLYQEGLIIPPTKYNRRRDWDGGAFERLLGANIRVPEQTLGDFNAQFAANATGTERVRQLCAKHGTDVVEDVMVGLIDYTESQLRAAIRALPDGVYYGEDWVDDDGITDEPLPIRVKVTIAGDTLDVDFAGTAPQVRTNINSPLASTGSAVMSCVKGVLLPPEVPCNEGSFRPITLRVPQGSILNPNAPAPVRARMEPCYRAYDAIMKALAPIVPDRAIASGFDATLVACLSKTIPGGFRVCMEVYGGGFGASVAADGADGIAAPLSNCTNQPVEALDMEYDFFRIASYGFEPDSFGHGRYRGGLGQRREYEVLADDVQFTLYADRLRVAPLGLEGGTPAQLTRCEILRNGSRLNVDPRKVVTLRTGDRIVIATSGGAGYGNPRERPSELVQNDVRQQIVPASVARTVYGEVV